MGQLLCILRQAAQEAGDSGERASRRFGLGVRTGDADRGLPRMARSRRDGRQKQRTAGDGLAMQVRIGETNEDVPPVVDEREHARHQLAAREIVGREAVRVITTAAPIPASNAANRRLREENPIYAAKGIPHTVNLSGGWYNTANRTERLQNQPHREIPNLSPTGC